MSVEVEAPRVVGDIKILEQASWDSFSSESIIFGLAQALNDAVEKSTYTEEEKGRLLSVIVNNLCEFNQGKLKLYYQLRDAVLDGKSATVH